MKSASGLENIFHRNHLYPVSIQCNTGEDIEAEVVITLTGDVEDKVDEQKSPVKLAKFIEEGSESDTEAECLCQETTYHSGDTSNPEENRDRKVAIQGVKLSRRRRQQG